MKHTWRPDSLLVTGIGRSGTSYTSILATRLGRDLGHERPGFHGRVDWFYAVRSPDYRQTWHQVRCPDAVITSWQGVKRKTWRWVYGQFPDLQKFTDQPIRRIMHLYYRWNLIAEAYSCWRYRIEEMPVIFGEWCERLQVVPDLNLFKNLATNVNHKRAQRRIGWDEMLQADNEMCKRIKEMAVRYGYLPPK